MISTFKQFPSLILVPWSSNLARVLMLHRTQPCSTIRMAVPTPDWRERIDQMPLERLLSHPRHAPMINDQLHVELINFTFIRCASRSLIFAHSA